MGDLMDIGYKIQMPDEGNSVLELHGTEDQARWATQAFAGTEYLMLSKVELNPAKKTATITIRGTNEQLIGALRTLYENELVDCDHEFTETVGVDDDRWIGADGELHERSNPDCEHCLICGKYYYPEAEEWRDE